MKIKGDFVLREIAEDYILVPTGKTALEFNGMITMNKVGAKIWTGVDQGKTREQILQDILAQFDTDEQTAAQDYDEFIASALATGFMEN